jgi:hypothetical protein
MIDFTNDTVFKLGVTDKEGIPSAVAPLLTLHQQAVNRGQRAGHDR